MEIITGRALYVGIDDKHESCDKKCVLSRFVDTCSMLPCEEENRLDKKHVKYTLVDSRSIKFVKGEELDSLIRSIKYSEDEGFLELPVGYGIVPVVAQGKPNRCDYCIFRKIPKEGNVCRFITWCESDFRRDEMTVYFMIGTKEDQLYQREHTRPKKPYQQYQRHDRNVKPKKEEVEDDEEELPDEIESSHSSEASEDSGYAY